MAIETLGAALRQINHLFAEGVVAGLPDGQLLERFLAHGDGAAFEALMGRHGPMVLSVCRGILHDPRDAEDAFQATFLILVQKGRSILGQDNLGGWLFRVARRVALHPKGAAARRRSLEEQVRQHVAATSANRLALSDDLVAVLHEEIARLPEKYRLGIVLCHLEGMTQAQAAGQLQWSEWTLRHRLARGLARLKSRLGCRGLDPDGAMSGAMFLREAQALVPRAWRAATSQAALDVLNHSVPAGSVSAAAQSLTSEVLKIMLLQQIKLASAALIALGVTAWTASAALGIGNGSQIAIAEVALTGSAPLVDREPIQAAPESAAQITLPGSAAIDPTRLARVRASFAPARVVQVAQVRDSSGKTGQAEFRELRQGDKVAKGDVLVVLSSVGVASKKNELLDALVQLELDQRILDEAQKHAAAVPEVFMISAIRAVEGDRNVVIRAINDLKLWEIPHEDIDAVHARAKTISADKDAWQKTPEGRWVKLAKQGAAAQADSAKGKANDDAWSRVALRAPIDGHVVERNVHMGELVTDNTVNLFQVADMSRLLIVANCPANLLPSLEALPLADRRCSVRTVGAQPGAELLGVIDEINPMIDPKQQTAVIKLHVDNAGTRIRAGQYVTVAVKIPMNTK